VAAKEPGAHDRRAVPLRRANNYGDDLSKVKQVQDGKWVVVWPKEFAAPGARLLP
jgi:hypothetical protein